MRLSQEELTANIDDDFKAVVAKLQTTFNFMAAKLQQGAPRTPMARWRRAKRVASCRRTSRPTIYSCSARSFRSCCALIAGRPLGRPRAGRRRGRDQILRAGQGYRWRRHLRHPDERGPPAFRPQHPRLQHLRAYARRRADQARSAGDHAGAAIDRSLPHPRVVHGFPLLYVGLLRFIDSAGVSR